MGRDLHKHHVNYLVAHFLSLSFPEILQMFHHHVTDEYPAHHRGLTHPYEISGSEAGTMDVYRELVVWACWHFPYNGIYTFQHVL